MADGCPVAVEVFEGNTADPVTLAAQIDKLKQRFQLQRVVMVVGLQPTDLIRGDRGLLTSARIEQTMRPAGLDWITALRAPAIKQLAAAGGPLQPSLFTPAPAKAGDRDMAEITSPDYPGERLMVCKNPLLAEQRARKRAELLAGTENDLARIAGRVQRARSLLRGAAAIGQAVGAVLGLRDMAKHFQISITDDTFSFAQNPLSIAAEAALDGIYVVRTKPAGRTLQCPHGTSPWADGPRHGARLQKSQRRRARLPLAQDCRSRAASRVPLDRSAGARPRPALHAGLLSAMAHAPEPRPDAVRRAGSGSARGATHLRWPRPSPRRRRNARPPANAPTQQMANHSRCTASTPCSVISPRSPAMSSASGAIASPPSSPPPPAHSTAPSICSALRPLRRQTDTTAANYINGLRSKEGKVRSRGHGPSRLVIRLEAVYPQAA
jgi:hypothetical protein